MTDDPAESTGTQPTESYYHCSACGCAEHYSRTCCPECGAYPGEEHAPAADPKIAVTLSCLLGGILLLALIALSTNREDAARAEAESFSRLAVSLDPNGQPLPIESTPTPVPTPLPVPTATPLPPTPTPIPFNPEDLAPKPTARPRPQPTPVPPTPVPEPTRSSTLDLKDQLAEEFRKDLDEKLPIAKEGEYIRLTLRDNRTVSGTITRMDANQLALQTTAGQRWILYRQLSRESRMRVDKSERDTWVEEKALEEVLKRLQN